MKSLTTQEAIELLSEAEKMKPDALQQLQKQRLKEIVGYVKEHSDYFREAYKDIDPENFRLEDLPSTDKKGLTEHYERWVTDQEITYEGVMSYLKNTDANQLYLSKYTALTTSGTSGSPMPMIRDSYHNTIHGAMISRRLFTGNASPEFMNPSKYRIASIIYTDPKVSSYRSLLKAKQAAGEYAVNMQAFSPAQPIGELARQIEAFHPDVITCYPSAMCAIAVEQRKGNIHLDLRAIACSAEALTEDMFNLFTETFHCPVINNYCSTEGGEAAMSCSNGHLHVNEDWVIIEPVDENRMPITDEDVWSEGILITDLTNYVQPVIRYYMNDQVKIHRHSNQCDNSFAQMEIQGRSGGITEVCGKSILITHFAKDLESIPMVCISQIAQTATDTLEIRAVFAPDADKEKVFADIESRVKKILDREGCEGYHIIHSDQEPQRNERGGKLQKFIRID